MPRAVATPILSKIRPGTPPDRSISAATSPANPSSKTTTSSVPAVATSPADV